MWLYLTEFIETSIRLSINGLEENKKRIIMRDIGECVITKSRKVDEISVQFNGRQ